MLKFVSGLLFCVVLGCGSSKPELRVTNNYEQVLGSVKVGEVDYGDIAMGATTAYQELEDGDHEITCVNPCSGTTSLDGGASFTLVANQDGTFSLTKDN